MSKKRQAPRTQALRRDPAVEDWLDTATTNPAALSPKQKNERKRVILKIDLAGMESIKERLAEVATELGTSMSQAGAYLLAQGLLWYAHTDDEIQLLPARTPKFANNVLYDTVLDQLEFQSTDHASDHHAVINGTIHGPDDGPNGGKQRDR